MTNKGALVSDRLDRTFLIIVSLTFLSQLAVDLILPSLPAISRQFHAAASTTQLSLTVFFLALSVSQFMIGPLSDYIGRWPLLLIAVGSYAVFALLAATTSSISIFILVRAMMGLSCGALNITLRAVIRDRYAGALMKRALAYQASAWALVPIIAPFLGSLIQHYLGWRAGFYILGGLGVIATIVVYRAVTESLAKSDCLIWEPKYFFGPYKQLMSHAAFCWNVLILGTLWGMIAALNTGLPFLLQQSLGVSTLHYGDYVLLTGIGFMVGAGLYGRVSARLFSLWLMRFGLGVVLVSIAILAYFCWQNQLSIWRIMLPCCGITLGVGLAYTVFAIRCLVPYPQMAANASALMGSILLLISTLASGLVSFWPGGHFIALSGCLGILGCICLLGLLGRFISQKGSEA